jgi:hypothetical protein
LLYDLTSTYFEGLCLSNPKAKRGYSHDSRPDCKQLVVGLVLDGEGFPKAHEIFGLKLRQDNNGKRSTPTFFPLSGTAGGKAVAVGYE